MANKFLARLVIGVLGVVGCATASAAPYVVGQVFASVGGGLVNVYNPNGTLVQTLNSGLGGFTTGSTFDSTGNLYVTAVVSSVSQLNNNGTLLNANWATGLSAAESIVFDAAGNAYIGQATAQQIRRVNSSGAVTGNFTTLQNTDWIDLAADGVTLLYSNEGSVIRQLNTVTLVDTVFNTPGDYGALFAKRYLANGDVIAASGNGNVYRWNSTGVLVQTYSSIGAGGLFALNLDPDGTSFWTGTLGGQQIRRVDLATGSVLASWSTGTGTLYGLSVFGEIQAGGGGGGGGGNNVPEPGTIALLGLGLIALAFTRRRKFLSA